MIVTDTVRSHCNLRGIMLALDIDGTVLDYDGNVSARVERAVRAVVSLGATVVLATGRSSAAAFTVMQQLGLVRSGVLAVCSNGSATIAADPTAKEGFHFVRTSVFDPGPAIRSLWPLLPDALVAVEYPDGRFAVSTPFPPGELTGLVQTVPVDELARCEAIRVILHDPAKSPADFHGPVSQAELNGVNYAIGYSAWVDIMPAGVTKASALESIRQELGIPKRWVVSVGDQRNDIAMLEWAALGIAMGQAPADVHHAADFSTASIHDDGLAIALEALVLLSQRRL